MNLMGTVKLGIKLVGTHAIISILEFFLLVPLTGLWENNQLYQWIIGLLQIFIFGFIIYADISNASQNELKRDTFWKPKGFFIGLVATTPALILFLLTMLIKTQPNYAEIILRFWLVPYSKILVTYEKHMPYLAIGPIILLPIITGLSYLDGIRKRNKILNTIKQSNAKRTEKSKVDR
jgi:hypothetical protein